MMPKRVEPRATESSTTAACRFMLLDCNHGDSTLPSSCCTAKITSITIRAPFQPTETSATRTATAPTTKAPTIGMKPPKKVSTARGMANGTPTRDRQSTSLNPVTNAHLVCRLLLEQKKEYTTKH